jgi:DNA helicase IV
VVVVEPAAIAELGDHGLRLLYIALTRAVRTLTLVHARPLPAPLR